MGEGVVKKGQKNSDVFYGRPHSSFLLDAYHRNDYIVGFVVPGNVHKKVIID